MNELLAAGGMALLAITSVGLWTLRVALTARGRRTIGATVAAVEAVIFAVAFTNVAAHLRFEKGDVEAGLRKLLDW